MIRKYSEQKLETYSWWERPASDVDFSSYEDYKSRLRYLSVRASLEEFKTEMTRFSQELGVKIVNLMETEVEPNGLSVLNDIFSNGEHAFEKLDWLFSHMSKRALQDIIFNYPFNKSKDKDIEKFWTRLKANDFENGFGRKIINLLQTKYDLDINRLGTGFKRDQFEFMGFTVTNAGLGEEEIQDFLGRLKPVFDRIKKLGLGSALSGQLIILSDLVKGKVFNVYQKQYRDVDAAGYYNIAEDRIILKQNLAFNMNIITHEIGHRHYFKTLSNSQRQTWDAHFKNRGVQVTREHVLGLYKMIEDSCPTITDSQESEYPDFAAFKPKLFQKKLAGVPELEEIVKDLAFQYSLESGESELSPTKYVQKHILNDPFYNLVRISTQLQRFANFISNPEESGHSDGVSGWLKKYNDRLLEFNDITDALLRRFEGKVFKVPHSTTEYGQNNPDEDYAEAFMSYVGNLKMPEDIMKEFIRINHIRMGSKKKASYD